MVSTQNRGTSVEEGNEETELGVGLAYQEILLLEQEFRELAYQNFF